MLIVAGILAYIVWSNRPERQVPAVNDTTPKKIATRAVRQLDKITTDPMLISSYEWNQESKKILNEWYGKDTY